MKKALACLLILSALCGCTAQAKENNIEEETHVSRGINSRDETDNTSAGPLLEAEMHHMEIIGYPYAMKQITFEDSERSVTFEIPETAVTKEQTDTITHSLIILNDGQETVTVGFGLLGVCGTGLEQREEYVNDIPVTFGYYDGSPDWSFAVFKEDDKPVLYVWNHMQDDPLPDVILQSIVMQ